MGDGREPVVVRFLGAAVTLVLGFLGTRWGAQAMLAVIALLAIAIVAIKQQMEWRKS
jgi:hypothetical protein